MRTALQKRRTIEALVEEVAAVRAAGRSVVLSNGVFDLLHVGHLRYLEGARAEGDVLIVAVNSDASTRANKGPGRPVIPEDERAELVGALECVDFVLVFEARDVVGIIDALRPDVHAKGTDYTVDTVPERERVRAYGGRVVICGDAKSHSTTSLIERAPG